MNHEPSDQLAFDLAAEIYGPPPSGTSSPQNTIRTRGSGREAEPWVLVVQLTKKDDWPRAVEVLAEFTDGAGSKVVGVCERPDHNAVLFTGARRSLVGTLAYFAQVWPSSRVRLYPANDVVEAR